jgi:hypothetical protein
MYLFSKGTANAGIKPSNGLSAFANKAMNVRFCIISYLATIENCLFQRYKSFAEEQNDEVGDTGGIAGVAREVVGYNAGLFGQKSYICKKDDMSDCIACAVWRNYAFSLGGRSAGYDRNLVVAACNCDGLRYGGLATRLLGIVSAFQYARACERPFCIAHTAPFVLEEYLVPAAYDWLAHRESVCMNRLAVKYVAATGRGAAQRLSHLQTKRQLHINCNTICLDALNRRFHTANEWQDLFQILFRPAPALQQEIDRHRDAIGGPYIATHFRFGNTLGDFTDFRCRPMMNDEREQRRQLRKHRQSDREQEMMIDCNLESLRRIQALHPGKKVFVATDSSRFAQRIEGREGCYIVPGRAMHLDNPEGTPEDWAKVFLDFFMIANAELILSVGELHLMPLHSEFARTAARVRNTPYARIWV